MARLMLSAGMLTCFASAMIVRRRGFMSGSPPPLRAATESSLMMRVKILPRFASAAPFLCLIVCHLEWPDMQKLPGKPLKNGRNILPDRSSPLSRLRGARPAREDHPDFRARIPRAAAIVAKQRSHLEPRLL